jgi:putative phage-type endonuclease
MARGTHPISEAFERRDVEPGSREWFRFMTGSKIAAVLGLSPYESPFSLHLRMEGAVPLDPQNDVQARGHYLEPAIRAWFKDQHPTWRVSRTGMWIRHDQPRYAYSPDGVIRVGRKGLRLFEAKSAASEDQWGEPGTDEIPIYYRCQLMWGMGVLGLDVAHLAVITTRLRFAEYVVNFDADDFAFVADQVDVFLDRLDRGVRPDIDSHDQTYEVLRSLHPDIDGGDCLVPADLAARYCDAKRGAAAAIAEEKHATSLLAQHMGTAAYAKFGKTTIARRQAKGGGRPYLVAGRNLPTDFSDAALEAAS